MAIFKDLLENRITESVVFRGRKIDVTFQPEQLTQSDWKVFADETLTEEQKTQEAIRILAKAIEKWSLEETEGANDFPPTEENLSKEEFPDALLLALLDRLLHLRMTATGKLKAIKI